MSNLDKRKKFRRIFEGPVRDLYPLEYTFIMNGTDKIYSGLLEDIRFSSSTSNPFDRRLAISAYFLALITVLDNKGESLEDIKRVCHEVVLRYVTPRNRFQKWIKSLPSKLIGTRGATVFFKWIGKRINKKVHPDGFVSAVITSREETYGLGYGVDILECGICKLFNKHNMGKFTPIMCEVDKVTTSLAGMELIRKGTIATGADKCDFRFRKKN